MLRALFITFLCVVLSACGRHPDEATLRSDVESVLSASFGDDTFDVVDFSRRGSATDSTAAVGETRRVVYFDIELALQRDLVLGDWEDPGAATLVSLLGAGPRSIQGVQAGGNVAGDRIVANGSAIYRDDGDSWAFVMPAGFRPSVATHTEVGQAVRASADALNKLADITRTVEGGGSFAAQRVVDQELQRSLVRITGRLSRLQNGYPLWRREQSAVNTPPLPGRWPKSPERISTDASLFTGGGEENIELLRNGGAVVALAQADTAHAAYDGSGSFASLGSLPTLRALGSLYPEYVHIVVRGNVGITTAAELNGARIAMGPAGSAVRATLRRVLSAHGLEPETDYSILNMGFTDGLDALRRGEVDAVAHVIGLPASPLRDAIAGESGLRLLPLAPEGIERLVQAKSGMQAATIAPNVYPGQTERVATVAVPALLLATDNLSPDEAKRLVQIVYEGGNDLLAHGSAQGSQLASAMRVVVSRCLCTPGRKRHCWSLKRRRSRRINPAVRLDCVPARPNVLLRN